MFSYVAKRRPPLFLLSSYSAYRLADFADFSYDKSTSLHCVPRVSFISSKPLQSVRRWTGAFAFLTVQLRRLAPRGHKPIVAEGKLRLLQQSSYACRG